MAADPTRRLIGHIDTGTDSEEPAQYIHTLWLYWVIVITIAAFVGIAVYRTLCSTPWERRESLRDFIHVRPRELPRLQPPRTLLHTTTTTAAAATAAAAAAAATTAATTVTTTERDPRT